MNIELKMIFPFVDDNGTVHNDLILTYAEDLEGKKYLVKQNETGNEYGYAVDIAETYVENGETKARPKYYSYTLTDKLLEEEKTEQTGE